MSNLDVRSLSEIFDLLVKIISKGRHGPLPSLMCFAVLSFCSLLWESFFQEDIGIGYGLLSLAYLSSFVIAMVRLQYFVVNRTAYPSVRVQDLWSKRETRFMGYLIALFAGTIAIVFIGYRLASGMLITGALQLADAFSIPTSAAMSLLILPFAAAIAYALSRLSYVFPAASVDSPCGFFDSWRMTKKNSLPLTFILCVLVGIDFSLQVFGNFNGSARMLAVVWVNEVFSLTIWSLVAALAYRKTIETPSSANG